MVKHPYAFLFAPGAGEGSTHCWMGKWVKLLEKLAPVMPMDYAYMKEGQRRPDPLPKLVAAHTEAFDRVLASHGSPIVLIGKSMGSRVGCHVSLVRNVAALVCLGYPLCGQGDKTKLRDQVLRDLRTSLLFVQGTRDRLCPLELLDPIRAEMTAPNELHIVEDGDHSLAVATRWLKEHRQTQDEVDRQILTSIARFLENHVKEATD